MLMSIDFKKTMQNTVRNMDKLFQFAGRILVSDAVWKVKIMHEATYWPKPSKCTSFKTNNKKKPHYIYNDYCEVNVIK